jgi:hypothetical protein
MATKIFDRETMLDLTVNFIPLFIILFFVVGFAVFNPFGYDSMATGIQYALLVAPFVFLAVLTYVSARAIAGDEKRGGGSVLPPGQSEVPGVDPIHHDESESAAELTAGDDEGDEGDATA